MIPIISGVVNWLKAKRPTAKSFTAPNDDLSVRVGTDQYQVFFISNADEAFTAASMISRLPLYHPATTKHGVIIATSKAVAKDPQVQSAIASNFSAASVYLGYLDIKEVKKWPPSAP